MFQLSEMIWKDIMFDDVKNCYSKQHKAQYLSCNETFSTIDTCNVIPAVASFKSQDGQVSQEQV